MDREMFAMKRTLKLVTSLCLSILLILSTLGMSAFAATPKAHKNLQYKKYCYLGDSIPFGYGLVSQAESSDPFSVGVRVKNSYPDLVGDGCLRSAGRSGSRRERPARRLFRQPGVRLPDPL